VFWIVFVLFGDSPAYEFYVPTLRNTLFAYEDETECSETSVHKIQAPGDQPKERIQLRSYDTRCCDYTICPPEDGHVDARNMSRIVM
jgi:hypothetical protein